MAATEATAGRLQRVAGNSLQAFVSLRDRRYRWWFASQLLSASGNMTQIAAMSWVVLQLSGKAVNLGLVSTAGLLPILLGGAWAGSLVDRFDRRRLLITTQTLFVVISLLLTVLTATQHISFHGLLAVALATGFIGAVDGPARQVFVLDLVGRDRLASAVSLYEVVQNGARVIGPATGGVLLAVFGPAACFGFNAASFAFPLAVLLVLRTKQAVHAPGDGVEPGLRGTLRYVRQQPVILMCLVLAVGGGMLFNPGMLFPLLATQVLHLGALGYGALMAAFGVGAVPGAIAAASSQSRPTGRRVAALGLLSALCIVPVGLAPNLGIAMAGTAVLGFVSIWFIALANTVVQLSSDPSLRGRVMGLWVVAIPGTGLVTALIVGLVADHLGGRTAFLFVAVCLAVPAALGLRSLTSRTELTSPAPSEH